MGHAATQGRLQAGDVLLQVNQHRLKGLTHQEIMYVFKSAPGDVKLLLCRPEEHELPPISQTGGSPLQSDLGHQGRRKGAVEGEEDSDYARTASPDPTSERRTSTSIHSSQSESPRHDPSYKAHSRHNSRNSLNSSGSRLTDSHVHQQGIMHKQPSHQLDIEHVRNNSNSDYNSPRTSKYSRTPTPVKSFLKDAGLTSGTSSLAATPSVEHEDNLGGRSEEEDDDPLKPGEYEVDMEKGEKGLGFTVAGGQQTTGYFYVKEVLYEPAVSDPRIQPGDQLIYVNGQDMRGLAHKEAVLFLRNTPRVVTIRFRKSTQLHSRSSSVASDRSLSKRSESEEDYSDHGSDRQEDTAPKLSVKDRINSLEHQGTTPILPHQYGRDKLSPHADDELDTNYDEQGSIIKVTIYKPEDEGSLGLSLIQGDKNNKSALFINSITQGGPIHDNGQLRVGDRLLQVNGQSVIGMAHNKAVAIIKKSGDILTLAVSRPSRNQDTIAHPSSAKQASEDHTQNTDSDVDSATLDDDFEIAVKQNLVNKTKVDKEQPVEPEDLDDPHTFDYSSDDGIDKYRKMFKKKLTLDDKKIHSESEDTDVEDSWLDRSELAMFEKRSSDVPANNNTMLAKKNEPPQKPPRRRLARLPSQINDSWLETLKLANVPTDSVHYKGKQLQSSIKQLMTMIHQEDPMEEYKCLRHAKLTDNCLVARLPENKLKNRYRNVLPYDANRVKLSTEDDEEDDYINASLVKQQVGKRPLQYIACQGPLPQTTGDFWRMIWEQNVDTIAMLTLDMEGQKVKCHRYWPDSVTAPFTVYDRYELSLVQVQHLENFDVNHVKMEDLETGQVKRITHLYYTTWPDHGSPETAKSLLQYLRFLHLVHDEGPIVVHCSAGIGRTGAMLTVDVALNLIEQDLKFDIQKIVKDLRRKRQGMIQTKDQYQLCYKACLEILQSLERESQQQH